ncbi:hypothetical protein PBT90_05225 [Algoriphagus halophytocola]|uniref:Tetratricopeptide repeat protein n=1 Tax=Algoriphagus halophytocola TaxID=2991499 RepID=A0ABY6MH64_9BACT|nr:MULTISPECIES: hypothetical protein [unclassified Algoriphagus]UZD22819.1 hypothetical protein OM944_19485 [Algoriphagus sp. TR-M5]WBL44085.1 hypothetical protein PBT90_05225 [Algoriphagus sp. TR-M9]
MNAVQFLDIIQKADSITKSELVQLKKVQENFPYFQIPHVLEAKSYYQTNDGAHDPEALGMAAITSPDRIWLKSLLENPVKTQAPKPITEAAAPKPKPQPAAQPKEDAEPKAKPVRRRKPPKDDLIETIKRREKKTILDDKKREQINLIKEFSKKSIKKATIKEIEANQNTENLAAKSTQIHDHLLSESYAKILAHQGKNAMAKEIYEKLILKFPDKRAYFADLIEKLKD